MEIGYVGVQIELLHFLCHIGYEEKIPLRKEFVHKVMPM